MIAQRMEKEFHESLPKLLTEETVEKNIGRRIEYDEEDADGIQRVEGEIVGRMHRIDGIPDVEHEQRQLRENEKDDHGDEHERDAVVGRLLLVRLGAHVLLATFLRNQTLNDRYVDAC